MRRGAAVDDIPTLARARPRRRRPAIATRAAPTCSICCSTRGHWCDRSRASSAADARSALDEALARLDERARQVAPGGWPEVQQRLARRASRPATEYLADVSAHLGRLPRARRWRAIWSTLAGRADPLRADPGSDARRRAVPLLPVLPIAGAVRSRCRFTITSSRRSTPRWRADEQQRRLRATNTSVIKLNHVVHHGAIGHHVQNSYAYAAPSEIGRVAAVDCASRIGMFLGGTMAEGWACYATDLMDEIGFLTPEESLAQQHTRARLLARAVVDIGLHERTIDVRRRGRRLSRPDRDARTKPPGRRPARTRCFPAPRSCTGSARTGCISSGGSASGSRARRSRSGRFHDRRARRSARFRCR